jgi:hypothetical protein
MESEDAINKISQFGLSLVFVIVFIVLIVCLQIALGLPFFQQQQTMTPSSNTKNLTNNFLSYVDSALGIKIQYPSNWNIVQNNGSVAFYLL